MPSSPRITSLLLCDAHKTGQAGKPDLFGVFTSLMVWAVPADRAAVMCAVARDLTPGTYLFDLWSRPTSTKHPERAGHGTIDCAAFARATLITERINIPLAEVGPHEFGISMVRRGSKKDGAKIHWLPLDVVLQPWPKLPTGDELKRALANPHSMKAVRVELTCIGCSRKTVFEARLDPTESPSPGVRAFPASGRTQCPHCDKTMWTKDLEGRVLAQLVQAAAK